MRRFALILLGALGAWAQTAPQEFSTIEGRVLNAITGEPVGKVSLLLMRSDASATGYDLTRSYIASSDSTGRFEIRSIDRGKYRLQAARNGFLTLEYGARASGRTGTVLDLDRPQQLKDVDLRVTPHGVIAGRVLDTDGEPMAGAQVQLLRSQYVNGRKLLSSTNTAYTNDLGEYRWSGLTAGRYYICAQNFYGSPATSVATEDYVPVYYPGSTDVAGAAPFDLAAGAQLRAGDIMLRKARTATVKGRVVVELAGARGVPEVRFSPSAGHNTSAAGSFRSFPAKINASGEFEIRGLTPGSYTAQAEIGKDGRGYTGHTAVELTGTNIEGVVITIGNGVTMSGRIRIEGEAARDLQNLKITLQPGGPTVVPNLSGFWTDRVAQDLTFKIDNLAPDRYGILIGGLPDGFYTKRIRAGESDVTYSGVDLTYNPTGQVDVLVSPNAGTISGIAQNPETGQPATGATAVLVPGDKERLGLPALYQQATTDQYGRFTFKNVVPGEYKVYAWEDVESSAWLDPDFMKPVEARGQAVTVAESSQANVQVNLILAPK